MKSFVSIVAGLLVIVILAVVTDTVLQSAGILPITGKSGLLTSTLCLR